MCMGQYSVIDPRCHLLGRWPPICKCGVILPPNYWKWTKPGDGLAAVTHQPPCWFTRARAALPQMAGN